MLDRFLKLKGRVDWIIIKEICKICEATKNEKSLSYILDIIKRLILLLINSHGSSEKEWY